MTEPAYTISSPGTFGSGELKTKVFHYSVLRRGVCKYGLVFTIGCIFG